MKNFKKLMSIMAMAALSMALIAGCGATDSAEDTAANTVETNDSENTDSSLKPDSNTSANTDVDDDIDDVDDDVDNDIDDDDADDLNLTDDQALAGIKNYCLQQDPSLADMVDSDDYTIEWSVESSDDDEIVVLYRSYTAAEIRYYVDREDGDVDITEYVPAVMSEPEESAEEFNIKGYLQ